MEKKEKKGYFRIALVAILAGAAIVIFLVYYFLIHNGRMTDNTLLRNAKLLATAAYQTDSLPTGGMGGVYYFDASRNLLTASDAGIEPYGEQKTPTDHTSCIIRVTITDQQGEPNIEATWYLKAQTIS